MYIKQYSEGEGSHAELLPDINFFCYREVDSHRTYTQATLAIQKGTMGIQQGNHKSIPSGGTRGGSCLVWSAVPTVVISQFGSWLAGDTVPFVYEIHSNVLQSRMHWKTPWDCQDCGTDRSAARAPDPAHSSCGDIIARVVC